MSDTLTKIYDAWRQKNPDAVDFQLFQAGFTAAAVSMRSRAMEVCDKNGIGKNVNDVVNAIKNGIGSLPDIPEK